VKPSRSSTPGPKFSMMMSHFPSNSTNTCLPSAVFMLTVIERLLQLSMVKYRLSAFGTSRSWARVASPWGFSNLMTFGAHPGEQLRAGRPRLHVRHVEDADSLECFHYFFFPACRVQARDAAAFGAGGFIDHGIDERGLARAEGFFHCLAQFRPGSLACTPTPPKASISLS